MFSAISVLARCEHDDVLVGTHRDDTTGLDHAIAQARKTVSQREVPRLWNIQSEFVLLATVFRSSPLGTEMLFNVVNRGDSITVEPPDLV